MKRIAVPLVILGVIVAIGLIVWSTHLPDDATLAGMRPLRVQLQWFDQAQFAGLYVAKERGFFADEKLDVTLIPGGYQVNPIDTVLDNHADIGLVTGDQLLIAEAHGRPVKAIGTVFYKSVACFMVKDASNINTPQDFVHKKVGVYRGYDTENVLPALLVRQNIPTTAVQIVQAGSIEAFVKGELDAFPSYVFNEPLAMKRDNIPVHCIAPDAFGVQFYSDTMFVSDNTLKARRDDLRRFLRAATRGWQYAEQHPEGALDAMYKHAHNLSKDTYGHQQAMLDVVLKYLRHDPQQRLFEMNQNTWSEMEKSLVAIGRIRNTGHVADLLETHLLAEAQK